MARWVVSLAVLTLIAVLAACGGEPIPTPSPNSFVAFPLPGAVSGIPDPDTPSAMLNPRSRPGGWAIGVGQVIALGHCGLASPLDFDGSLWDPAGAHDGAGRPINADQEGDLINSTPVSITLVGPDTALLVTRHGAVVLLERHFGPRAYPLCD